VIFAIIVNITLKGLVLFRYLLIKEE
jgi:hypothetical protein